MLIHLIDPDTLSSLRPKTMCGIEGQVFQDNVLAVTLEKYRKNVIATRWPSEATCPACRNGVLDAIGYKGPRYGTSVIQGPEQPGSSAAPAGSSVRAEAPEASSHTEAVTETARGEEGEGLGASGGKPPNEG